MSGFRRFLTDQEAPGQPGVAAAARRPPCQAVGVSSPLSFDPIEEAGRQWRTRWGVGPSVPMMAVTSVMRVQQMWLARLNETLVPFELTFSRYEALMLLYFSRAGSLPMGKIGARLQVHPTSVTNLIDGLEKIGYVRRVSHPDDRRTTLAVVTSRGRRVAAAATEALNEMQFGTAPLGKGELQSLTDVLTRVRAGAGDFT